MVRFFSRAFGSVGECKALAKIPNQESSEAYAILDKAQAYILMKNGQKGHLEYS
jgi:hypothetical protein